VPQFTAVGKPNLMVSLAGLNPDSLLTMNQVSAMQADELVETTERLVSDKQASRQYTKTFDQIIQESQENEVSWANLHSRAKEIGMKGKREHFDLNRNQSPRIIQNIAGRANRSQNSYLNQKLRANMNRAMHVSHGVAVRGAHANIQLEVCGQSQLIKELKECGAMKRGLQTRSKVTKVHFEREALHLNEIT
jgi:hypothetical protein